MMIEAINNLRPNTEWTLSGTDVTKIVWHTEGVEPLTKKQVNDEIARLTAEKEKQIAEASAARAAAIEHAKSLGFTDAMIAVMYPTLVAGDATE